MLYTPQDRIVSLGAGMQVHAQAPRDELVFLFKDTFPVNEAAPMVSPRTCEVGTATITGNCSVSSNQLNIPNGATYVSADAPRASGIATWIKSITSGGANPWYYGFAQSSIACVIRSDGSVYSVLGQQINGCFTGYVIGTYVIVCRSAGEFYFAKEGSTWYLVYVSATSTTTPRIKIAPFNGTPTFDNAAIVQMGSPLAADYDIATNRIASPAVGETTTQTADGLVEMTWQAVTGQTWNLMVRRTDDSNYWTIRCSQGGSTMKLIEVNAGVETERASTSLTFANGTSYRVLVRCWGNTIGVNRDDRGSAAAGLTYNSATFNNTATGVKTDRAGTNLIAWPRTLSGAALAELQRVDVL